MKNYVFCFMVLFLMTACSAVPISVSSDPEGADVIINGRSFGKTPTRLIPIRKTYKIEVIKCGYEPYEGIISKKNESPYSVTLNKGSNSEKCEEDYVMPNDPSTSISSSQTSFSYGTNPFTEVVQVDQSISGDALYYRARSWFALAFKDSRNVIQMDSPEKKTIIGKGSIQVPPGSMFGPTKDAKGWVTFTFSIYAKDGRYKYEITDLVHENTTSNMMMGAGSLYKNKPDGGVMTGMSQGAFNYIKSYTSDKMINMIDELKTHMSAEKTTSDADW